MGPPRYHCATPNSNSARICSSDVPEMHTGWISDAFPQNRLYIYASITPKPITCPVDLRSGPGVRQFRLVGTIRARVPPGHCSRRLCTGSSLYYSGFLGGHRRSQRIQNRAPPEYSPSQPVTCFTSVERRIPASEMTMRVDEGGSKKYVDGWTLEKSIKSLGGRGTIYQVIAGWCVPTARTKLKPHHPGCRKQKLNRERCAWVVSTAICF
jgi:hypothetical protein